MYSLEKKVYQPNYLVLPPALVDFSSLIIVYIYACNIIEHSIITIMWHFFQSPQTMCHKQYSNKE